MAAGPVRAGDDDDDDKTFEEKIIEGIMAGIGGTNMENKRHRLPRALAAGGAAEARSAAAGRDRRRSEGAELAQGSRRCSAARQPSRPARRRTRIRGEAARILTPSRTRRRQDRRDPRKDNDPVAARHQQQQSDPEPVAARLSTAASAACSAAARPRRRRSRASRRGSPDPAAARLPDAVAELCLRHRAEGIAEQGIQPGQGKYGE